MIIDDQLAFVVGRGAVSPPDPAVGLTTTYAFQLRLASSLLVDRTTTGALSALTQGMDDEEIGAVVAGFGGRVAVVDPTKMVAEVARAKRQLGCNLLAAEVVAAARSTELVVRLSPGNATGRLAQVLLAAEIDVRQWSLAASPAGLAIIEADLPGRLGR